MGKSNIFGILQTVWCVVVFYTVVLTINWHCMMIHQSGDKLIVIDYWTRIHSLISVGFLISVAYDTESYMRKWVKGG